ncbi:MAG TPA: glycosyl hydrolase [Acidimicrobiales bacterium]|nr:glycosyl hydrolase [Acidimicrobiales bacterium]
MTAFYSFGTGHPSGASARHVARAVPAPFVPISGSYFGADPNFSPGTSTPQQAAQLAQEIGHGLSIVSFYTSWLQLPVAAGLNSVVSSGAIPMINMNCGASDAAIAAGNYDAQIRTDADILKGLGHPVLFRWFWEMNLNNVATHQPCLGNLTTAGTEYVAAFQRIWEDFQSVGATNVAFVWCPSAALHAQPAARFYPGSKFVNWIGADIYDRAGYGSFAQMYSTFYGTWHTAGKPMIVCETGAVGSASQVSWLGDLAWALPTLFPQVHAFVYVDAQDIYNYVLETGTSGLAQYSNIAGNLYYTERGAHDGFVMATAGGQAINFGTAGFGSVNPSSMPAKAVGIASLKSGQGYWVAGADGSVYAFGAAPYYGSMRGLHLNKPIVGITATPDGRGYWLVASDGGIFSFGDARFHGSTGNIHLNKPILAMASSPDGKGYWLVASDGGIFTFGDCRFYGSTGGMVLNKPIIGMSSTADGKGYWLAASDGGLFTFGDAHFEGSLSGVRLSAPVAGIQLDPESGVYRMVTQAGVVYQFPGGQSFPSPFPAPSSPVIGFANAA